MQRTLAPAATIARWPMTARRRGVYLALASLGLLALALLLPNLPYAPAPWFDEGSHLHVPQTLLTHGVYADISSEGFRYFGPTIGVGPTVMLPIAAVFKLGGVSILAGRLVIVAYALLALLAAALLAQRLHGPAVAPLALTLLLASRTIGHGGLVEYGRQVLGEVPGLAFLLLGCLAWQAAINATCNMQRAEGRMQKAESLLLARGSFCLLPFTFCLLSGLAFGLALITKNQFALVVGPGLALVALLDWGYYRQGNWALRLLPPLIAGACFGAWMLFSLTLLGPSTFAENLALTRRAAGGAIFVFDGAATLRALRYLAQPYAGLLVPALVYGFWRCRERSAAALAELPLVVLPALWLGWYVISLGWPRYAFPAVALGALAVARLLYDMLAWLWAPRADGREIGDANQTEVLPTQAGRFVRGARRAALMRLLCCGYLSLIVALPLGLSLAELLRGDDSVYLMAAQLDRAIAPGTIVETWEPELGLLTSHRYHYPPTELLDAAVRGRWLGGSGASYPPPAEPPPYLVLGPFGRYSGVYAGWVSGPQAPYIALHAIGPYTLYQLQPAG